MNVTPMSVVYTARTLLGVLLSGAIAAIYSQSYMGNDNVFVTSFLAHFAVLFLTTALTYVAFPKMRRSDLTLGLIAVCGALELVQFAFGQHGSLTVWLVDASGALCFLASTEVEQLRRLARTKSYVSFSDLRLEDRRRSVDRKRLMKRDASDVYDQGAGAHASPFTAQGSMRS